MEGPQGGGPPGWRGRPPRYSTANVPEDGDARDSGHGFPHRSLSSLLPVRSSILMKEERESGDETLGPRMIRSKISDSLPEVSGSMGPPHMPKS